MGASKLFVVSKIGKQRTQCTKQRVNSKIQIFFVTEDLTRYRQGIIHELSAAKRLRKVHSNDGRIFIKLSENCQKYSIKSISELHKIAPPPSDEQQG